MEKKTPDAMEMAAQKNEKGKAQKKGEVVSTISEERLSRYFSITKEALEEAEKNRTEKPEAYEILEMATLYYRDAEHFRDKGDWVTAFAALNYAHGWLDTGARLRIFAVNNSRLFTVDD